MGNHYKKISNQYRREGKGQLNASEVEAYVKGRMPATKAAIKKVFEEIASKVQVKTLLDIGAGPGTGALAALEVFPDLSGLEGVTLIEKNPEMIQNLEATIIQEDALRARFPKVDLALFGYSYGEMEDRALLEKAWEAARVVVIVEPGTPRGYETIMRARDILIELGGVMLVPCPHRRECPLRGTGDWCHFSVRLQRSKEHRALKEGTLGWEDEKFSYVAFTKEVVEEGGARILRHPLKHKGHTVFELCTEEGLEKRVVSKKQGPLYKEAKKLKWGDLLPKDVVEEGDDDPC